MTLLLIPYPEIDPVLIQLGPFAIRWYALAYIAGLVIGWQIMRRVCERARHPTHSFIRIHSARAEGARRAASARTCGAPDTQAPDSRVPVTEGA